MCGICGCLQLDLETGIDPGHIRAMCATLVHRGPDDEGVHCAGPVALGHRRLSIIDVEGGHQPLSNEDGTVWVTYNGEIYNHSELKRELNAAGHQFRTRCDTEVLVHLYEEEGPDFVKRLNGMFAVALWDATAQRLVLARDRMGQKPLYWSAAQGRLAFASELKAILALPGADRQLDLTSFAQFLTFACVPAPRTIFQGIHKLPPAGRMIVERGQISSDTYWRYRLGQSHSDLSVAEAEEQFLTLLRRAVRRRLMTDVPLGVFLSGGIDSSMIAAMMCESSDVPVKSFAIGFSEREVDESHHARSVATHLGTEHHEQIVSAQASLDLVPRLGQLLDEPFADSSVIPTLLLSQFAHGQVKVALGGDGGDELLAGYPLFAAHRLAAGAAWLPRSSWNIASRLISSLPDFVANTHLARQAKRFTSSLDCTSDVERHYRWRGGFRPNELHELLAPDAVAAIGDANPLAPAHEYANGCLSQDPVDRMMFLEAKLFLQDDVLVKVDRASMAASLEVRAPFLDPDLVEFLAALPLKFKLRGMNAKYLLKRVAKQFLPAAIVKRPKQGFALPVASWLRGEFREPMCDLFDERRLRQAGIFAPQAVQRLVDEHLSGQRDHHERLWRLFVFEQWRDAYLPASGPPSTCDESRQTAIESLPIR